MARSDGSPDGPTAERAAAVTPETSSPYRLPFIVVLEAVGGELQPPFVDSLKPARVAVEIQ